jgi:hypothetical protein
LSSDAGVVLLKDIDAQLGLTRHLAAVLADLRDPRRIKFTLEDLIKQRVFQIAAGYEDANDSNTLRDAPSFQLLRNRLPATGTSLASPPTLSRFENRVSRPELYRPALALWHQCIASYTSAPKVIVLAGDDTEDPVHGGQEHARYDRYDGGSCFMPLHVYEGLSGRLITTILKAKRFPGAQRLAVLQRLGKRLRQVWPHTLLIVRGDRHFAYPAVRQWIAVQPSRGYVTGLTSNVVLPALAREVVEQATRAYALRGHKVTRCHSTRYQAGTWSRPRRVVIKVAVSEPGLNTRLVVIALAQARTKVLYQKIYCARGQADNAIKEHKLYLKSDRTSCHRFDANPWRVLLHSAASVLRETLRREVLQTTQWASATMETIQLRLLKVGARVQEGEDRITISCPSSCPVAPILRRSLTLWAGVRLTAESL